MGTRADFYVGAGQKAEWIGSVAWDGYEWGDDMKEKTTAICAATTEDEFRKAVKDELDSREDATNPEDGWPWPWETSDTTDRTVYFNRGKVKCCDWGGKIKWPVMSTENFTMGERSGAIVISA